MPITPFHFGLGLLSHELFPNRCCFLSFCAANIVIDIEPGIYLTLNSPPFHRFFHTLPGLTSIAVLLLLLASLSRWLILRHTSRLAVWLQQLYDWRNWRATSLGILVGVYSHWFLDHISHTDTEPFTPFVHGNPFLGIIDESTVVRLLFYSFLIGLILRIRRKSALPSTVPDAQL